MRDSAAFSPTDAVASDGRSRLRSVIPEATVARLPVYLRALRQLEASGTPLVSSAELAASAGVNSATLRKDLSYFGSYGTRGLGYPVTDLSEHMERELGLTQDWPVVLVGLGSLGQALAKYAGFRSRGFRIRALLDTDPSLIGTSPAGVPIRPLEDVEDVVREHGVTIAVIATPADAAQDVADRLVAAGITSILNFAPVEVVVPADVQVRKVDLAVELQILAFHEQRRQAEVLGEVRAG